MKKHPRYWKPLMKADYISPEPEDVIAYTMKEYSVSREEALKMLNEENKGTEYWINDLYQVQVRYYDNDFIHLNIRRRDGAIIRDWRHLQEIKNQLIGEECEAVELYPAESRKVDTSNKFHLFGFKNQNFRFPFGFQDRDLRYENDSKVPGMKQRPF